MPEHLHMLISLPETGDPSMVVKSVKQRSAARFLKRSNFPSVFPDGA
jgi:REP element-mobilizing transposase RayT